MCGEKTIFIFFEGEMESNSRNSSQESFPVNISKQLLLEPNVIELQNAKPKKMETSKQTLSFMILQVLLTLEIP